MWSRRLSTQLGMDQEEFVKALITGLSNDKVQAILKKTICDEIITEVRDLTEIVKKKDDKIKQLEAKVAKLEAKCDDLEQYSRRNSLRISGIAEDEYEDVSAITMNFIKEDLKKDMTITSIDRVHRVGAMREDGKPRPILVKFATYRDRAQIYKSRSMLKNKKLPDGSHIYINEDLSQRRSSLLYNCRKLKKAYKIQDCWSSDGQILVKDNRRNIIVIRGEADLVKLEDEEPVLPKAWSPTLGYVDIPPEHQRDEPPPEDAVVSEEHSTS